MLVFLESIQLGAFRVGIRKYLAAVRETRMNALYLYYRLLVYGSESEQATVERRRAKYCSSRMRRVCLQYCPMKGAPCTQGYRLDTVKRLRTEMRKFRS